MRTLLQNQFYHSFSSYKPVKDILNKIIRSEYPLTIKGPQGSFTSILLQYLHEKTQRQIVVVVPTENEANQLVSNFRKFGAIASVFPWWSSAPYAPLSPDSPRFAERVGSLTKLLDGSVGITCIPLRALCAPVPPVETFKKYLRTISLGDTINPVEMEAVLVQFGFTRVPRVSVRGEFALRGEVLDIFLPGDDNPLRIVFSFDEVEEIKAFDVATQLSLEKLSSLVLHPVKEFVWTAASIDRIQQLFHDLHKTFDSSKIMDRLQNFGYFEGEEIFYPVLHDRFCSVLEYCKSNSIVAFLEHERLQNSFDALCKEYSAIYGKTKHRTPLPPPESLILDFEATFESAERKIVFPLLESKKSVDVTVPCDQPRSFFGNINYFKEELEILAKQGYTILIIGDTKTQSDRISYLLKDFDVQVEVEGPDSGFSLPELKKIVIHEKEIFGRKKRSPASLKQVKSQAIETFIELNPGDYIVHVNYGIGRFNGIKRLKAGGNERDYIHLEYAGEEFIYIPIEQVNLIQRYIGSQGNAPKLDKIGGKSWDSRKGRVRKSVEDLADMLIGVYSRRKTARGFAFPGDTDWQLDFEARFEYEETDDQLKCIADVKSDMEQPVPMDRLVCGDVGYGKTEIALRAAFKAVTGGKQVAILAPTTILAEQHYENMNERIEGYPVKTGMLSRLVQKSDQKKVLKRLANGDVDILIGTHRIIQKDVVFKDLGLLVIDEEQRFGVKAKERLKEIKASIDCLTLTATPIPRTLHMSMLKIRDMSVLETPPYNRRPIETHIEEFSEETIVNAIRAEIERGGQVFYLHNRVETLNDVQRFIEKIVPEALVETAHGQMSPTILEDIMHRFIHGGFHVLVSTTIIENGIDIPNANTIIIDRADMYGISQLYQLRGRVGRSDKLAFAYLLYPERQALSELAMKRLKIISDNTQLGSGFKIAMKDLEVRGAGNLLGRQQSGDILSVGFDMYLKLLDEAIRERSDSAEEAPLEIYLELEYSGYIPDSFISEPQEKMEVYKKISSVSTKEELDHVHQEISDRYGPLPDEVISLLCISEIRIVCKALAISSLKERRGSVEIEFAKVAMISIDKVMRLIRENANRVNLDPKRPNVLHMKTEQIGLKEKTEFILTKLSTLL